MPRWDTACRRMLSGRRGMPFLVLLIISATRARASGRKGFPRRAARNFAFVASDCFLPHIGLFEPRRISEARSRISGVHTLVRFRSAASGRGCPCPPAVQLVSGQPRRRSSEIQKISAAFNTLLTSGVSSTNSWSTWTTGRWPSRRSFSIQCPQNAVCFSFGRLRPEQLRPTYRSSQEIGSWRA